MNPLFRRRGRIGKTIKGKAPGHQSEAYFLTALPVDTQVRRILFKPILKQRPKGSRIFLVTRSPIGPHQDVRPAKPAQFPDVLDVAKSEIRQPTPMNIRRRPLSCEMIPMPVRWKTNV